MRHKANGFALIETIVAIVILAAVLAGATTLIWSATSAVQNNQDRLTATYLAQECLELARNTRDTAWRQHQPWSEKLIDKEESSLFILNTETKFSRTRTVSPSEKDDSLTITCEVSWSRPHVGTERVSLTEILTNWRKL